MTSSPRTLRIALLATMACVVAVPSAQAAAVRRIFEPTDLELEDSRTVELDLQFGLIRGASPYRVSVPDFELDIGLTDWASKCCCWPVSTGAGPPPW